MSNYRIYALLPVVKMPQAEFLDMGPITFTRASQYHDCIEPEFHDSYERYISKCHSNYWARVNTEDISVKQIDPKDMTAITLDTYSVISLDENQRYELIFDAVNLLFFLANVDAVGNISSVNLNYLKPYLKIHPISNKILENEQNWSYQPWYSHVGIEAEIHTFNKDLLDCFGKVLLAKYLSTNPRWARRVVRAIKYYNRIFDRDFDYIISYGSLPEDAIFLSIAFESLLDVHFASPDAKNTLDKIKLVLQNTFNIKYPAPQKILDQWVDEFYNLRSRIVHGDEIPDIMFHGNKQIDVPFILLGAKIFIAALICRLYGHACMTYGVGRHESEYVESFYVYLWTQNALLENSKNLLIRIKKVAQQGKYPSNEIVELRNLESIYLSVYCDKKYPLKTKPCNIEKLKKNVHQIISIAEQKVQFQHKELRVMDLDNTKINGLSKTERFIGIAEQDALR